MTAPSPASGLPQEAVEISERHQPVDISHMGNGVGHNCERCWKPYPCDAVVALALLAAERAKVAALQQAVDKVRELCTDPRQFPPVDITGRPFPHLVRANDLLALLPDVQADDRGTDFLDPSQSAKGEQ